MTAAGVSFDSEYGNQNGADPTRRYLYRNAQALLRRQARE